ncbi:alpha/beta fold hydrolase [Paenibacillus lactis]|uniref:alpha/beta fold hydrolase n=1 Tax=Paenibacillus lactis TaxID=228574 RepID=UPI0039F08D6D
MDLYYEIHGKGKPILMIHSGGADSRDWSLITPLLQDRFQVIAMDGRGIGNSPSPVGQPNYILDVLSLLDHLNLPQAAIVGHSMGGQIATEFAIHYPERVSELVLIAPALSGYPYSDEFQDYMKHVGEAAPDVELMIERSIGAPSYEVARNSPQRELMVDMLRRHFLRTFTWPAAAFAPIWPTPPAYERLEEIQTRTLFIIGDQELPDNLLIAESFQRVPDIRFVRITGADHMVTLTHPEAVSQHITDFVED